MQDTSKVGVVFVLVSNMLASVMQLKEFYTNLCKAVVYKPNLAHNGSQSFWGQPFHAKLHIRIITEQKSNLYRKFNLYETQNTKNDPNLKLYELPIIIVHM